LPDDDGMKGINT